MGNAEHTFREPTHPDHAVVGHLTYLDSIFDMRFRSIDLFRKDRETVLALLKHKFSDPLRRDAFKRFYEFRGGLSHKNLLKIVRFYPIDEQDYSYTVYFIKLLIEYPYNDLKLEIRHRLLNELPFSPSELFRVLKKGVSVLHFLKSSGYAFQFSLSAESFCFLPHPSPGKYRIAILEFNNRRNELAVRTDLEELYAENCRNLATVVLEAGILLPNQLAYSNVTEKKLLALNSQFYPLHRNELMHKILESFLRADGVFSLEQAFDQTRSKVPENQRYVFDGNRIVLNPEKGPFIPPPFVSPRPGKLLTKVNIIEP